MDQVTKLLNEEIERRIETLTSLESGTEEEAKAVDNLTKLYKLRIEEIKNQNEDDDRYARRTLDEKVQNREAEERVVEREDHKKDRFVHYILDGAAIIVPVIFYGKWMKMGFKFEETGTLVSPTFRNLYSKFKPVK